MGSLHARPISSGILGFGAERTAGRTAYLGTDAFSESGGFTVLASRRLHCTLPHAARLPKAGPFTTGAVGR